jgi:hypothetical protein
MGQTPRDFRGLGKPAGQGAVDFRDLGNISKAAPGEVQKAETSSSKNSIFEIRPRPALGNRRLEIQKRGGELRFGSAVNELRPKDKDNGVRAGDGSSQGTYFCTPCP